MINNKLTVNYKKSFYVIVSKRTPDTSNFNVSINHNKIGKNCVKYLGVYINDKLTWKNQIDLICSKLSRVCGMVFKLRHYVPLSTLKLVYYSLFHSNIQYSLIIGVELQKVTLITLKFFKTKF